MNQISADPPSRIAHPHQSVDQPGGDDGHKDPDHATSAVNDTVAGGNGAPADTGFAVLLQRLTAEAKEFATLRNRTHDAIHRQIGRASLLCSHIRSSDAAWQTFSRDPFWAGRPPRRGNPMLAAMRFVVRPCDKADSKPVSKWAQVAEFFAEQGVAPDGVSAAIKTYPGGIEGVLKRYRQWRVS